MQILTPEKYISNIQKDFKILLLSGNFVRVGLGE